MTLEKEYYQRWLNAENEIKQLKAEIERMHKKAEYNANFKEELKFTYREIHRYEYAINKVLKKYDELKDKSLFLLEMYDNLVELYRKFLLLDNKFSDIKLSANTCTNIVKNTRNIIHGAITKYKPIRTVFKADEEFTQKEFDKLLAKKRKKLFID